MSLVHPRRQQPEPPHSHHTLIHLLSDTHQGKPSLFAFLLEFVDFLCSVDDRRSPPTCLSAQSAATSRGTRSSTALVSLSPRRLSPPSTPTAYSHSLSSQIHTRSLSMFTTLRSTTHLVRRAPSLSARAFSLSRPTHLSPPPGNQGQNGVDPSPQRSRQGDEEGVKVRLLLFSIRDISPDREQSELIEVRSGELRQTTSPSPLPRSRRGRPIQRRRKERLRQRSVLLPLPSSII